MRIRRFGGNNHFDYRNISLILNIKGKLVILYKMVSNSSGILNTQNVLIFMHYSIDFKVLQIYQHAHPECTI